MINKAKDLGKVVMFIEKYMELKGFQDFIIKSSGSNIQINRYIKRKGKNLGCIVPVT